MVSLVIAATNQAPYLQRPVDRTVREGETLKFKLNTIDPDSPNLTYTSKYLPAGAIFNPNTGEFIWTPDYTQAGEYNIGFTVSDGNSQSFALGAIKVLNVNAAPIFDKLGNWEIPAGKTLSFNALATDPDRPIDGHLTYTVANLPTGATFNSNTGEFKWTPTIQDAGTYHVTFTATDDGNGTGEPKTTATIVPITVVNPNHLPVIAPIANHVLHRGDIVDIPVVATDADGNSLSLSAAGLTGYNLPDFATFIDNGNGTGIIRLKPDKNTDAGNYTFNLTATENRPISLGEANSSTISTIVQIDAPNDAPKLAAIPDSVAVVGEKLELVIQAKDLNQDNLTFGTTGLPAGATITPTGIYGRSILTWTPTAADIGNYPITLKVTDSGNGRADAILSNEQIFNLVVRANNTAPVLGIVGNKSIAEESTLTFQLTSSDANGDKLNYTATNLPTGAKLDAQTGTFSWKPTAGQAGVYQIEFTTSDGNKISSEKINLTVAHTNHNPILTALPLQHGLENETLKFGLAGSDVDLDPLVYTILGASKDGVALPIPTGVYLDQNSGRFAWTPNYNQSGEYTFKFAVIDTYGTQDTKDVNVLIDNINRQPTLSISNRATTLGKELKFNVDGNDLDLNTQLVYSAEDLPPGATLNAATGEFKWNPNPGQLGDYTVKFTVSDGSLATFKAVVISAKTSIALPKITVDLTPSFPVISGQKVVVNTLVDSIASIANIQVKLDGNLVDSFKYNSSHNGGSFNFSSTQTGRHNLEITTTDVDGRSSKIDRVIKVKDVRDTLAPVVELPPELNGAKLTTNTQIVGKIADTNLDEWKLEIAELGTDNYRVLTSGNNPTVTSYDLPVTSYQNGFYELRLTGTDISGRTSSSTAIVEVNTPTKSGYQNTTTDLALTLAGIPVNITRHYAANTGKWTFNTDTHIQLNLPPTPDTQHPTPPLEVGTRLYLTTPTGERVGFTFTPVRQQITGAVYYTPAWVADAGVNYTLQSVDAKLTSAGGKFYELTSGVAYNPASNSFNGTEYTLTAIDRTKYLLDSTQGLVGQIAPNGTKLIYSDSGIISTTGEAIGFVKDKAGKITEIMAPDGTQLTYEYDTQGQLVSLRNNTTGKVQSFGYDANGQLQAIVGDASVVIDAAGTTRPIQANLLGIANLNGNPLTTTTALNQTYSFNVQASELNTTSSYTLLIGVEGEGTSQINGIAPVYTKGNYQIFTVDKAGINLLDISNPLLRATNYELRVIGDLNGDGKVDGIDSQLLTNAFTKPFDTKFDLNRDGVINALDLQLLGGNYGFIAAGKQPSNPIPTKLGTVRTTPSGITLLEGAGLVTQMTKSIAIDHTPGQSQFVTFDLNTAFDLSDRTSVIEDQFAVYLVDPTTHQTILDRGERGTSLFSLTGKTAEFAKGLVTYDGQKVSIDLGSLKNIDNAELVFQLINNDKDTTGVVNIQNLTDTLTKTSARTLIGALPTRVAPGAVIANLASYTPTTAPKVQLTNVRLDSTTGKFIADLRIENTGTTPLPRQLAVLFPNLPAGVTLVTKSGVTGAGTPYINLHDTMVVGGLAPRETNTAISIEFDDINLVRLDLQPTFLAGAQDVAPTLRALGTINLHPGQVFSIPLIATDPNGAPITMTVDTKGNLPTGALTGDNTLVFKPTPDQLGTYTFTLIAKQGLLTTSETVTLNVIADAITTTRLSGKVNRDKLTALGGAVVDIGGVLTTTNADGSFLITLPTNTATTVKINGVTQQLSQLLGHQLYSGANNQVGETIYIPTVDTSGTQTSGNTVTNSYLPKVTLTLPNSLTLPLPTIQLGSIDSSLIPPDLFTTGTPKSLVAVTTTDTLTTPAKLTLGNDFTVDPGTSMDLWRIDPNTGIPTIVGLGKVNANGTIETISGGVMGAGWYYYVPTPVAQQSPDDNAYNPISNLDITPVTTPINSEANLFTGVVTDSYQLQGYQALGVNQSWQLSYSSKRANPEQTIYFQYKAFQGSHNNGLFAKLILSRGTFSIDTTRQWKLTTPPTENAVEAAIKIDTSTLDSGVYTYDLAMGLNSPGELNSQSQNRTRNTFVHVNNTVSPFGQGWGLNGLQKIAINNQNLINETLLLIDGNGSEQVFTVIKRHNGITEYGTTVGDPSTFTRDSNGFTRTLTNGTTYKFNNAGFLLTVEDRHHLKTTYEYINGIISKITDPVGLDTIFHSNGNRIDEITDPAGRRTKLNIDGNGDLTFIKDPDLTTTNWLYNGKHLMTDSTDKLGNKGKDFYDDFGRVTNATRKDGSEVSFIVEGLTYLQNGAILTAKTETGNNTTTVSSGYVPILNPGVNTQLFGNAPKVKLLDGNGHWTETTFNRLGEALIITDNFGTKINKYNSRGSVIQTTDEKGNITSYNYNDRNQVIEIAYGDKLSSDSAPALYSNFSDSYSTATSLNYVAYVNDSVPSPTNNNTSTLTNYLVSSDKRGQIVTQNINFDGKLDQDSQQFSLQNKLGLTKSTDKLTVKKLLVGDFNNDGIKDVAVGYERQLYNDNLTNYLSPFTAFTGGISSYLNFVTFTYDAGIAILKGDGTGKLELMSNKIINPISDSNNPFQFEIADLVAADFNNDGNLDIVAANFINPSEPNWTGANNYQLFMLGNDGQGKLSTVKGNDKINRSLKPFKTDNYKGLLATVKQGNQKFLAVASPNPDLNGSTVSIYSSNGDGELTKFGNTYAVDSIVQDIKTADLNGDGVAEIIIDSSQLYTIDIVTGVMQASDYLTLTTGFWSFIDVADVNKDGKQDILLANDNSQLKVFLADKNTGLYNTAPQIYQGTASPRGLFVKDINQDSLPDVVIADAFGGYNIKLQINPLAKSASVVHKLFTYDPTKFGQLTQSIDEEGRVTDYELNSVGDITKITKRVFEKGGRR